MATTSALFQVKLSEAGRQRRRVKRRREQQQSNHRYIVVVAVTIVMIVAVRMATTSKNLSLSVLNYVRQDVVVAMDEDNLVDDEQGEDAINNSNGTSAFLSKGSAEGQSDNGKNDNNNNSGKTDEGDRDSDKDGDNGDLDNNEGIQNTYYSITENGSNSTIQGDAPMEESTSNHDDTKSEDSVTVSTAPILPLAAIPSLENVSLAPVESILECQEEKNKEQPPSLHKLVFVHVYKTAGSTLRHFFDEYAQKCRVGWAVVVGCSDLTNDFVTSGGGDGDDRTKTTWRTRSLDDQGEPKVCTRKRYVQRGTGKPGPALRPAETEFLVEKVDILGGHFPLGVGAAYALPPTTTTTSSTVMQGNEKPLHVRYVTFFRQAVDKYISGILYVIRPKDKTMDQILDRIRDDVYPRRRPSNSDEEPKYHVKYAHYLLTPYQQEVEHISFETTSAADLALQVMQNILDYQIVCGITERWSASMELLEEMMDAQHRVSSLFASFGRDEEEEEEEEKESSDKTDSKKESTRVNTSAVSTKEVIAEIQQRDAELYGEIVEYVKYEQQIYDFAVQIHERQYERVRQLRQLGTTPASIRRN